MKKLFNKLGNLGSRAAKAWKPMITWRLGMYHLIPLDKIGTDARELIAEIGGRADVPDIENMPRDLKDYVPNLRTTKHGGSIASYITNEDVEGMSTSPASIVFWYMAVMLTYLIIGILRAFGGYEIPTIVGAAGGATILLSMVYVTLGGSRRIALTWGIIGAFITTLGGTSAMLNYLPIPKEYLIYPTFFALCLAPYLYLVHADRKRINILEKQSRDHAGSHSIQRVERADDRMKQALAAIKEDREFTIHLGTTLGVLADVILSPWVADAGLPMIYAAPSLSRHTLILGASGRGKSAQIRGIVKQVAPHRGLLVMDFKVALARELRKLANYQVITPDMACNMMYGVAPDIVVETLSDIQAIDGDKNPYFTNNGKKIALSCCVLLDRFNAHSMFNGQFYLIKDKNIPAFYNPGGFKRFVEHCVDEEALSRIIEASKTMFDAELTKNGSTGQLADALSYLESLKSMDKEQVGSFFSTALTMLNDFFIDTSLAAWAESTTPPFDFEQCFTKKAKVGIEIGELQGATGVLYLKLFNYRFKRLAKSLSTLGRTDLSPVFLVVDECASLLQFDRSDGLGDDQMVSIYRSLKVEALFACQSISQLYGRFSNHSLVNGFLVNIHTIIDHGTNGDAATYDLLASRVGPRPKIKRAGTDISVIDFQGTYNSKASSPVYDLYNPNRQEMLNLRGMLGIKSGYDHGKLDAQDFKIKTYTVDVSTNDYALDKAIYTTWLQSERVAFAHVWRGGAPRQDFIRPFGVDENLEPYDYADAPQESNDAIAKRLNMSTKAFELISEDKFDEAAFLGETV